jgi:hypothetical protein
MDHAAPTNRRVFAQLIKGKALCIVVLLAVLVSPGCVRRRLNVRSNPPGALVYVDNQQIGTTPCSVDFIYYGTREIRLIKPGYETLTVNQPIPTPWYQIPPLDFVSENLVWTKIRDNRTVTYNLAPLLVVPTEQLVDRANHLRQDAVLFPVQRVAGVGTSPVVGPLPGAPAPTPATLSPPPATTISPGPAPPASSVPFPPPSIPPAGGSLVPPPLPTTPGAPQVGPPIVSPPLR